MRGHRSSLKVAASLVVAIACAGGAYLVSSGSTEAAGSTTNPVTQREPVSDPVAGSPDLTDLSSPWLGYTVTLPIAWAFTGSVAPEDSATPHDSFVGQAPGSSGPMMIVIGRSDDAPRRVVDHRVDADGGSFAVTPAADMGDGAIALVAEATMDGANWYVMGHMPDDAASREFFDRLIASFRFPDVDPGR
jgi:hypothetical protein